MTEEASWKPPGKVLRMLVVACAGAALTIKVLLVIAFVALILDGFNVIPSWNQPLSFYAYLLIGLSLANVGFSLAINQLLEKAAKL